jgi:hypothetical protein
VPNITPVAAIIGAAAVATLAATVASPISVSIFLAPIACPKSEAGICNSEYVRRKAVNSQPTSTCVRPSVGIIRSAATEMPERWM